MAPSIKSLSATSARPRRRKVSPSLEGLEGRLLLYSTLGAQWAYGVRITYSFVPDGANIGGYPSALFQTLDAKFSTATWQQQFQKAAAVWEAVANINLVQVPDDGSSLGASGNQQGDPRFGDIRFSAISQSSGTLAVTFLPPPINGGSDAGDIVFNSSTDWRINSAYDLQTVAIHEIGHALGMGHSQISTAVMYAAYNAQKQKLTSDDVIGIQSIWQAPQPDQFNSNGRSNSSFLWPASVTSYIDASAQVSIPGLALNTTGQNEWFYVTVPASTTGTMVATVQSSGLSSLSPKITVFNSMLLGLGQSSSTKFGDTVSVSVPGVRAGQGYLIRVTATPGGTLIGDFGLQLNFGSDAQAPIAPPNTAVPERPDQGGGMLGLEMKIGHGGLVKVGNHIAWGETLTTDEVAPHGHLPHANIREFANRSAAGLDAAAITTLDLAVPDRDNATEASHGNRGRAVPDSVALLVDATSRLADVNEAVDHLLADGELRGLRLRFGWLDLQSS
ncbi:MAG: matrixin family metalloprotease [Isosphaeraceae bacterium]